MSEDQRIANLRAFLDSIARFESEPGERGYRLLYGGDVWQGPLSMHPFEQGWRGVDLPPEMCKKAGYASGICKSTAAGRYQIIYPTWKRLKAVADLQTFEPEYQDRAAVFLLGEVDALQLIEAGQFDEAVMRARRIWASMPNAGYGQAEHSLDKWRDAFADAGGVFA